MAAEPPILTDTCFWLGLASVTWLSSLASMRGRTSSGEQALGLQGRRSAGLACAGHMDAGRPTTWFCAIRCVQPTWRVLTPPPHGREHCDPDQGMRGRNIARRAAKRRTTRPSRGRQPEMCPALKSPALGLGWAGRALTLLHSDAFQAGWQSSTLQ